MTISRHSWITENRHMFQSKVHPASDLSIDKDPDPVLNIYQFVAKCSAAES